MSHVFLRSLPTEVGPPPIGQFLFAASPLLQESAALLETQLQSARRPKALDIGAGSGRDAALLAALGWDVIALDRDERALKRLQSLAARQGLEDGCSTICANLAVPGDLLRATAEVVYERGFDLVIVNRHLHRPTLPEMANLLAPPSCRTLESSITTK
eukprot:317980-Amphidinium_carterae.1